MCYDIKTSLEAQLRRARRQASEQAVRELEERLRPYLEPRYYHVSGYAHPYTLIYTNRDPWWPLPAEWGLIPRWVKDHRQKEKIRQGTLNARAETLFEKPAFRQAARYQRCIIVLEGFYEHRHFRGRTYPYLIQRHDRQPFSVAGIFDEWANPATGEVLITFSIVTTRANELLSRIHNNPRLGGPRMPAILTEEQIGTWLAPEALTPGQAEQLLVPCPARELEAYTVPRLRGRGYPGNVPQVCQPHPYDGLPD